MLEKLGPVGVYQSIRTFTELNYNATRIIRNLGAMEGWALQTPAGRALAEDRKQFSIDFARVLAEAYEVYAIEDAQGQP